MSRDLCYKSKETINPVPQRTNITIVHQQNIKNWPYYYQLLVGVAFTGRSQTEFNGKLS